MILNRYLIKEILQTWLATTIILMLIFMSTQFVHYLTGAAIGRYAAELIFKIMAFQIPILLGLLLPVGFYGAILMAYGRLHADREIVVLNASGYSTGQLLKTTYMLGILIFLITALFSLWLSPLAGAAQKKMIEQAQNAPPIETLLPGRFFTTPDDHYVLFVDQISSNHRYLKKLFLAEHISASSSLPEHYIIITAGEGSIITQKNDQKFLVIDNGHRYDGIPGLENYQIDTFDRYSLALTQKDLVSPHLDPQKMSTWSLLKLGMKIPAVAAELQWRISSPLSVFILVLLAIPLARVNPRQGRFAQIIPATLIYIIYANLMFMTRTWIENHTIPIWLGVWWLHGLMLCLGALLLATQERIWHRIWYRWTS